MYSRRTWDVISVVCDAFIIERGAFLLMHTSLNGDYSGIVQAHMTV